MGAEQAGKVGLVGGALVAAALGGCVVSGRLPCRTSRGWGDRGYDRRGPSKCGGGSRGRGGWEGAHFETGLRAFVDGASSHLEAVLSLRG